MSEVAKAAKFWEAMKAWDDGKYVQRACTGTPSMWFKKDELCVGNDDLDKMWLIKQEPDTSKYLYQWLYKENQSSLWTISGLVTEDLISGSNVKYKKFDEQAWAVNKETGFPEKVKT